MLAGLCFVLRGRRISVADPRFLGSAGLGRRGGVASSALERRLVFIVARRQAADIDWQPCLADRGSRKGDAGVARGALHSAWSGLEWRV